MSKPQNIAKSGLLLTAGQTINALCSFARNIIIARLLSVDDYGIAATFALALSAIEMVSNLALDKMIIQAHDGESDDFLGTAHLLQVIRGVLGTIILFLSANLIADLFGIAHIAWAFQLLSLVPLLRGFAHLDMARMQRHMKFHALIWADTFPQVLMLILVAPLALWLEDFRAMLFLILLQALFFTGISHIVAERPYFWSWDGVITRRIISFGWPVLINGLLMFGLFQGDRAIIGIAFSTEELGWYSSAFILAMMPALMVTRVIASLLLPLLSNVKNEGELLQYHYEKSSQLFIVIAFIMASVFLIAGPAIFLLMYGDRYINGISVLPWLALAWSVRLAAIAPNTVAVAQGNTLISLQSTIVRSLAIVLGISAVLLGFGPTGVAISGLIGEIVSLVALLFILRKEINIRIGTIKTTIITISLIIILITFVSLQNVNGLRPLLEIPSGIMISLIIGILIFKATPGLYPWFKEMINK